MRIYLKDNVLEAAKKRMRWVFDEFPTVIVGFSGGKDSTVVLNIALEIAAERGIAKLPVLFIDQEAEWQATVDYVREMMDDPRVQPYWLQIPIKLFNATSPSDPWLYCWEAGKEWIRPQQPDSIKENILGTDRFGKAFTAFPKAYFGDGPVAIVGGVRAEESPARLLAMTAYETYKGETWGKQLSKHLPHYTFYPIYDWSYTDVWHCIESHGWNYCRLYDQMYQHGVSIRNMRVSNVHHETATETLTYLQEIEPQTWNAVTRRLTGINTVNQLQDAWYCPEKLPWMFKDWWEYRDHLLETLVPVDSREHFANQFKTYDDNYRHHQPAMDRLVKVQIAMMLVNDLEGVKLDTFRPQFGFYSKAAGSKGGTSGPKRYPKKGVRRGGKQSGVFGADEGGTPPPLADAKPTDRSGQVGADRAGFA